MMPLIVRTVFVLLVFAMASPVQSQQNQVAEQVSRLPWQSRPAVGAMGSVAKVSLSGDLRFLDSVSTRRFLELNGNPPRDNQYTLAPRSLDWFAIFVFDPSGYVRDDDRLNPDELLKVLRRQNQEGMEERRRLKLPTLRLDGWAVAPHYDAQTRRLEWGTRLIAEDGSVVVNYLVRILGRSGVMNGILVSDPENLEADIKQFHTALRGYDFVSGERYAEFRQGDHIAEYGLAALIVGGAAAAAASSGAMKGLGKFLGLGAIALFAAIGGFFKRLFGRTPSQG